MPDHRNMVRSLCVVRSSFGPAIAQALATIRFSASRKPPARALRLLSQRKGLSGAHLLESQSMAGMRQTTEQKIRGGDVAADRVLLVGGYDNEAVKAAAGEIAGELPNKVLALYRLAYTLSAKETG